MSSSDEDKEKGFECTICDSFLDSEDELREHRIEEHSDKVCSECGAKFDSTPFDCNYCGENFCSTHRLPENHDCSGLENNTPDEEDSNMMYMSSKKEDSGKQSSSNSSSSSKISSTGNTSTPNMPEVNVKSSLSRFYRKRIKGNRKFIPVIALLLLFFVSSYQSPNMLLENGDLKEDEVGNKLSTAVDMLQSSIVIENNLQLLMTAIIVFTIWSTYRYWLKDWKYTRRNSGLLEKIVAIIIFIVLVERHISLNSTLGTYADWTLFLMVVYIELAGTWFLAKTIDGIDLSSDLYNWGLRLLGGLTILFGALMFVSSGLALSMADSQLVFNNVYWIGSVCLMLLGSFMEYRSFRRHPAIKVW